VTTPGDEWIEKVRQRVQTDAEGWASVPALTKAEAEALLDWLEARGCGTRELSYQEGQGFTVRWRGGDNRTEVSSRS
jgi:hypothetical protein